MPYLLDIKTNINGDYLYINKLIARTLLSNFSDITSLNDFEKLTKDSAFQLDIDGDDFQGLINLYQDSICFELSLNQNQQKLPRRQK